MSHTLSQSKHTVTRTVTPRSLLGFCITPQTLSLTLTLTLTLTERVEAFTRYGAKTEESRPT